MTTAMSNPFNSKFGPNFYPDEGAGTGAAPKEEKKETPAGGPDLAAKVKELEAALGQSQTELVKVKGFKDSALAVFREDTPPEQRVAAYRQVLSDQGIVGADQDNIVAKVFGSEKGAEKGAEHNPNKPDALSAQNREDLNRLRLRAVQREIDACVATELGAKEVTEFSEVMVKLHGQEEADKIMATVKKKVQKQTIDNLSERKAQTGAFNEDWIGEEANKALTEIVGSLRAVIGDPSKIGRVPETVTGIEALVKSKAPVKPPVYEKGDGLPGVNNKFTEFAEDRLLRAAVGLETGGPSRV